MLQSPSAPQRYNPFMLVYPRLCANHTLCRRISLLSACAVETTLFRPQRVARGHRRRSSDRSAGAAGLNFGLSQTVCRREAVEQSPSCPPIAPASLVCFRSDAVGQPPDNERRSPARSAAAAARLTILACRNVELGLMARAALYRKNGCVSAAAARPAP